MKLVLTKTVELTSSSFYVDDFLTSVSSSAELLSFYSEVRALLSAGGFYLSKFCTNCPKFREVIPPGDSSLSAKEINFEKRNNEMQKALHGYSMGPYYGFYFSFCKFNC